MRYVAKKEPDQPPAQPAKVEFGVMVEFARAGRGDAPEASVPRRITRRWLQEYMRRSYDRRTLNQ